MGAGLRADTIKIIKLSIKHPIVLTAIPGNWFLRCQENPKGAGAVRALPPSLPLFDHCRRCARRRAAGTLHLDTCDKLLFFRVFFGGGEGKGSEIFIILLLLLLFVWGCLGFLGFFAQRQNCANLPHRNGTTQVPSTVSLLPYLTVLS